MKFATLLTIALFAAAVPGRAAPSPFAVLEKTIEDVRVGTEKVRDCFGTEKALRADHARKKAEYALKPKGKMASEFDLLLSHKLARATKVRQACIDGHKTVSEQMNQAHHTLRNFEPKSTDLTRLKSRLDSVQTALRDMLAPDRASSAQ